MEQWIVEQMDEIKGVYKRCSNNKETALESYSIYMLRMLNGLAQMELSEFYYYEKKVLWNAMKIFCDHYVEQVKLVLNSPAMPSVDKKKNIEDIEDAVSQLSNVYKNVVDSTANSDRQMFSSLAVDTNIYDLSPKLFAFYSRILEKLVAIYGQQEVYAFLLHPTIKNNIETISLFDMRNETGKVVLIYIPENRIEEVEKIPVYLLHEAYHVLTKESRHRKERTWCLYVNVLLGIEQRLFQNIIFFEDAKENRAIKKRLMNLWFGNNEHIDSMKLWDKDDRRFYSASLKKRLRQIWERRLQNIMGNLAKDLISVLSDNKYSFNVAESGKYNMLIKAEEGIRNNLLKIIHENTVSLLLARHMSIYRETYADLACILTLQLDPKQYEAAFRDTVPFIVSDDEYTDIERELRTLVVGSVVKECSHMPNLDEWVDYVKNKKIKLNLSDGSKPGEGEKHSTGTYMEQDLECYHKYLLPCAQELGSFLESKKAIQEFRAVIKNPKLEDILSGRIEEQFDQITVGL